MSSSKKRLIGVSGKIGCGKSTVVEYLKKRYNFEEYSFAKPLKELAVILGFKPHQVNGTQEDKLEVNEFWGISGRRFLQVFGSEVCRDYLPTVLPEMRLNGTTLWVRLFEKHYQECKGNLAIGDLRFVDECEKVKELGGIVIKIVRGNSKGESSHQSEAIIDSVKPDFVIMNNGSLEDLYKKIDQLLIYLEGRN